MHNIKWNDYRHPKFLQSLHFSLTELKSVNLFLKRPNSRMDANQECLQELTLVSSRESYGSSNILTQDKVSIKI